MRQIIEKEGKHYLRCIGYKYRLPHDEPIENFHKDRQKPLELCYMCKTCCQIKSANDRERGPVHKPHRTCPTCGSRVSAERLMRVRTA